MFVVRSETRPSFLSHVVIDDASKAGRRSRLFPIGPARFECRPTIRKRREIRVDRRGEAPWTHPRFCATSIWIEPWGGVRRQSLRTGDALDFVGTPQNHSWYPRQSLVFPTNVFQQAADPVFDGLGHFLNANSRTILVLNLADNVTA